MKPQQGAILGIDYGERKIGFAITVDEHTFVFGRGVLSVTSDEDSLRHIRHFCEKEGVTQVVIGLPLHKDGRKGKSAYAAEEFAKNIEQKLHIPVVMEDERMSTALAKRLGIEAGKPQGPDDEEAAKIILQSYLDRANCDISKNERIIK